MRFFVHSGEATQEVVERYDSATLALEAVSVINQTAPNIRVFNEYGEHVTQLIFGNWRRKKMNPTTPSGASGSSGPPKTGSLRADVCREWPLAIARRQHLAQCSSGNGNLRPETFGETRRER